MGAKRKNEKAPAKEVAAESVEEITNVEADTGETGDAIEDTANTEDTGETSDVEADTGDNTDTDEDTGETADIEDVIAAEAVVYPYQVAAGKSIVHKKKCLASGSEVKPEWFSSDQLKALVKAGLVDKA